MIVYVSHNVSMKSYPTLGIIRGRKVLQITFFGIGHEKTFMILNQSQKNFNHFIVILWYYVGKGKWINICIVTSKSK